MAAQLPDAPTNEPREEGQPEAKKLKVDAASNENIEEGWEELDKSAESAENGPAESKEDDPFDMESAKEKRDAVKAAAVTMEADSKDVQNRLEKDW